MKREVLKHRDQHDSVYDKCDPDYFCYAHPSEALVFHLGLSFFLVPDLLFGQHFN